MWVIAIVKKIVSIFLTMTIEYKNFKELSFGAICVRYSPQACRASGLLHDSQFESILGSLT